MVRKKYIPAMVAICCLFLLCQAQAGERYPEKYYQEKWCTEHGGVMEYVLPDGARVDCLTGTQAVEFDWAKKWAEGYGQAKYYAAVTGRRGVVVLIVGPDDGRYLHRLRLAAGDDLEIETMDRAQ